MVHVYNQILCKSSPVSQHSNQMSNTTRIQFNYRDSNISDKGFCYSFAA